MSHTCDELNCNYPVFGGRKCKYHQYKRRMKGGDLYKDKTKKQSKPPRESKTRKAEHKLYSEQIKLFWDESLENKTDFCFFCGVHMDKRDNIHHLRGRTGDYYLDKEYYLIL